MARCELLDLLRLDATLTNKQTRAIPAGTTEWQSIVILNPLAAPMYVLFSGGDPSAAKYDLVIPGAAMFVHPIPKISQLTAINVYPGAVPAADVGLAAIIRLDESLLAPFVGPLA